MIKKFSLLLVSLVIIFQVSAFTIPVSAKTTDGYFLESKYFIWECGTSYLRGNISPENFSKWMTNIDRIYEATKNLVGRAPHTWKKISIIPDTGDWFSMYSSQDGVISWNTDYIASAMKNTNETGNVGYGIVHEIGHIFDDDGGYNSWVFNSDFSAGIKLIYALEKTGLRIEENDNYMLASKIAADWNADGKKRYDKGDFISPDDGWDLRDFISVPLREMFYDIGWESLKNTYRSYYTKGMYTDKYRGKLTNTNNFAVSEKVRENHAFWDFYERVNYFSDMKLDKYFYKDSLQVMHELYPDTIRKRTIISNSEFAYGYYKQVTIPKTVTLIEEGAFSACKSLKEVVIPESINKIERYTFNYCESLTDIYIYSHDIKIDNQAIWEGWDAGFNIAKNVTIHSYKGSTAEKYAKKYGFKFKSL